MAVKRKSKRDRVNATVSPRFEIGAAPDDRGRDGYEFHERGPDGYEFLVWDNDAVWRFSKTNKGGWIAACPSRAEAENVTRALNLAHHGRGDLPLVEHLNSM